MVKKGGFAQKGSQLSSTSLPAWLPPLVSSSAVTAVHFGPLCTQLLTVSVWKVAPSTLTTSFHTLRKGSPMASSLEVLVETQRLSAMPEPCKLKSCIITEDFKFRFGSVDLGCSEALGEGGRCKLKRDRRTDTYNCILVCYRHMDGKMRL